MTQNSDELTAEEILRFNVQRSIRYHHRRAGFIGGFHRFAMFLNLFMAMFAGVAALQDMPWLAAILGISVALSAAIAMTLDSSNGCARHMLLAYRFQELEKKFLSGKVTDEALEAADREKLLIEQDEPPPLRLLDVMCHYELLRSMGHHQDRIPTIGWRQAMLSQFLSQTEYAQRLKSDP